MNVRLLLILLLKFEVSLSVTTFVKNCCKIIAHDTCFWINEHRFKWYPLGRGLQHYFLDIFYVEYFSQNSSEMRKRISGKISIFTHIYLLARKILQNQEKLKKMCANLLMDESIRSDGNNMLNVFDKLERDLSDVLWRHHRNGLSAFSMTPLSVREMCYLLRIKHDLVKALNYDSKIHLVEEKPKCYEFQLAYQSVKDRDEQLSEWLLSDLMLFFPKRKKLVQFFDAIFERGNVEEYYEVMIRFAKLIGFSRAAMIFDTFAEKLGFFLYVLNQNRFFAFLYFEYLNTNDEGKRWRSKIVLEKFLYDEMIRKMMGKENGKIVEKRGENDQFNFDLLQAKLAFVNDLSNWCQLYSTNFWLHEKSIRALIGQLAKESWRRPSKAEEILSEHRRQITEWQNQNEDETDLMHLFENGPEDVSLFRALALCVPKALDEYGTGTLDRQQQKQNPRQTKKRWDQLSQMVQIKMLNCVGKHLKSAKRKDEIVAKLHLDKMIELFEDEEDELNAQFKENLIAQRGENFDKFEQFLDTFLDIDGIKRVKDLMSDEIKYFSTAENFSSSDDDELSFNDAISKVEEIGGLNCVEKEITTNANEEKREEEKAEKGEEKEEREEEKEEREEEKEEKGEEKEEREEEKEAKVGDKEEKELEREEKGEEKEVKEGEKEEQKEENEEKEEEKEERGEEKGKKEEEKEEEVGMLKEEEASKREKIWEIISEMEKGKEILEEEKHAKDDDESCLKRLKQFKMQKYSDLLSDKYLAKFYKNYLENELGEECSVYLHLAMFVRPIFAKIKFIKIRATNRENKIWKLFEEKWQEFEGIKMPKMEKVEFILDKMNFVDNELNGLTFGKIAPKQLRKAIEIIGEAHKFQKMPFKAPRNEQKMQITQFKTNKITKWEKTLIRLHLQIFCILSAKKFINSFEYNLANNDDKLMERFKQRLLSNEKIENEFIRKYISEMEAMLMQQKLACHHSWTSLFERSQYSLIRTSSESRKIDLEMANAMTEFVQPYSMDQCKRTEIFEFKSQINQIVQEWIQNIPSSKSSDQKVTKAKLLRNGSFLMNSELDGSDLDLICVVPEQLNWFHFSSSGQNSLYSLLEKKLTDDPSVSWRPGKVPLIRIERGHIVVDLLLVPVPDKNLADGENLNKLESDELIKEMNTDAGIYSLAGYQSGKFQLSLVQSPDKFSILLKIVKIWAKNRLIYSGLFGFFNGITLSIMTTQICVLFPNSPLSFLLLQFFSIYAKWHWPSVPIMLRKLTPATLNPNVRHWPPQFGQNSMTVITPTFPEQNAAFNVNTFTLRTIVQEFKIANEQLSENAQNWKRIFEQIKLEQKFGHFALIVCSAVEFNLYASNCAYQKSKLRQKLFEWANLKIVSEQLDNYHLIPNFEQKTHCDFQKAGKSIHCTLWLVGLTLKTEHCRRESNNSGDLIVNLVSSIYSTNNNNNNNNSKMPSAVGTFLMRSFYTEAEMLYKTIDNLRHTTN